MSAIKILLIILLIKNKFQFSFSCHITGPGIYGTIFTCDANNLDLNLPEEVSELKLYGSMSSIPSLYFAKYYYTRKLNLESLKILKIIPGVFNRLNNLKILHLNKNNLTNLGDGIFNSLIYLEELYLEFNKIK